MSNKLDIRDNPEIIEIINSIVNNHGIAEIKKERDGIAVVEINRKLRTTK